MRRLVPVSGGAWGLATPLNNPLTKNSAVVDQCEGCFVALGCPRSCGGVVEAPAGWVSRVGLWGVGVGLGLLACKIGCPGGSGVGVLPARPRMPREGLLWG